MDAYLLDWLNLLLRWAHVIVAIAWIGSSFYFVFLDNSLVPPGDPALRDAGVSGELWAVHGGGFYNPQKYAVAPREVPPHLHWFYWESYSTWLTGFGLFTALYLVHASSFLIDRNVHAWSAAAAIASALGFLAGFWVLYDGICRSVIAWRRHTPTKRLGDDALVGLLVALVVACAAWLACQLFAGRAAFLLVGAMLATAMSANVFVWIIPGQRKVIAQLRAGEPVDPRYGQRAKQRSVHNTYFTLPVLFAMLSNHAGFLYTARHNWLVLLALMAAGALIRHSFVARHKARVAALHAPPGTSRHWLHAGAGCVLIAAVVVALRPAPQDAAVQAAAVQANAAPVTRLRFAQVQQVIEQRCVLCHNAQVQNKGIALHTPALIVQHAQAIHQQAVVLKQMPMGNATGITDDERALLGRWYEAGAPSQ